MGSLDELRRENRALRDRAARLSAAMLRISESLDVEMVLHESVESARALTGARYGLITTIDPNGELQDFVSSGLTAEEHRQMAEWPDGPRLSHCLRDLPAPLRVADVSGYMESLGLSSNLWNSSTLQITPMYHRGEHLGNFFLSDKRDGGDSPVKTKKSSCCLRRRRPSRSQTPAPTGTKAEPGPIWKRWSTPRR